MTGTLINFAAVIIGSLTGLLAGKKIHEKTRQTLLTAVGLFLIAYGILIFGQTQNMLIPLVSMVLGTIIGELLNIEERLNLLGESVQQKVARFSGNLSGEPQKFVTGFVTASILFCIGPMALLGALQDGITGNYEMLAIKSLMDLISSMALASTLGVGVIFSAFMVLVYQGGISLLAGWIGQGVGEGVVAEVTATGGVILVGIAISSLLELKKIRIGSFLPSFFVAILIVILLNSFGVSY
ncbi:MAG: DUF554 domain-containing protein [Chloroflexi bacterium]|nr:DUF554 domain-containing protein [Chloroflexota bacterium]